MLKVTSEDTDIVGVKRLCRSLPGLNEGSFDKDYSWANRIATQLWVYVLPVVVIRPQLHGHVPWWCLHLQLGLYNNNKQNVHSQPSRYPITSATLYIPYQYCLHWGQEGFYMNFLPPQYRCPLRWPQHIASTLWWQGKVFKILSLYRLTICYLQVSLHGQLPPYAL